MVQHFTTSLTECFTLEFGFEFDLKLGLINRPGWNVVARGSID
jgi:hypothetical protein